MRRRWAWMLAPLFVFGVGAALATDGEDVPARSGRGEVPWGTARELTELARELQTRERDLDRREAAISEREEDVAAVEAAITERLDSLSTLRGELQEMLDALEAGSDARVDELVVRVEAMRDSQAALVLAETEPELAVEVLRRMQPSKAGKALAKMPPGIAANLGEGIAAPLPTPELP